MSEPSLNSMARPVHEHAPESQTNARAGVLGDHPRPFSHLAGSTAAGARALLTRFSKQAAFVVLFVGIGGYVLYNQYLARSASVPIKPVATSGNSTGAPLTLGAQGDNGKAPGLTPAAPAPSTPPPPDTPANPAAPLSCQAQVPPPPNSTTAAPQGSAPLPKNRLDASFFTDGQQQAGGTGIGNGAITLNPVTPVNLQTAGQKSGEFSGNLNPATTAKAQASMLANRSLLLTKGTLIDCVLNTALTSGLPGMVSCTTTKPVYSDNGKTLLIDRGSIISGEFNGQMKTGQSRMYVLWTRVKTPTGVVANLDSPGADALGRPGLNGEINKHWWERIGSAFMLSLVQDAIGYAATRGANNNNGASQMYFQNMQQSGENMASVILRETINIPPTLSKNQGDRVTVYVARDVDFSNVYQVTPTP